MAENQVVVRKALKSKNRNLNPFIILLLSILVIYTVVFTYMLIWAFYNSFKPAAQWNDREYMQLPVYTNEMWSVNGFFQGLDQNAASVSNADIYFNGIFYNYSKVIVKFPCKSRAQYYAGWNLDVRMPKEAYNNTFFRICFNTLFYSIAGAAIIAVVPCVVGYVSAKYDFKFNSVLYAVTLFVMIMPLVGTEPARIKLLCRLYLFDTMIGDFIVNFTFCNMYYLVFLAFFQGVSGTYAEAAEVDGASQIRTMVTIIMPLASKMITTILLIFFIGRWNNYTTPLVYMPNIMMFSYRLYMITTSNANTLSDDPTRIAGAMILVVPIVILFVILRNKIMGNISMGGLKE